MKQLLSCSEDFFVVGLNDWAYAVRHSSTTTSMVVTLFGAKVKNDGKEEEESKTPDDNDDSAGGDDGNKEGDGEASSASKNRKKKKKKRKPQNPKKPRNVVYDAKDIQAVAIYQQPNSSIVWCAVSRGDKCLEIYNFDYNNNEDYASKLIEPSLVYDKTPKRIKCMTFAVLNNDKPCLIGGDVSGDAYAYCLTQEGSRLLLGHTTSMLTGIQVYNNNHILTADRDEKIRVTCFPETYDIDGYLLGHENFVTSIGIATEGSKSGLIASCGGDSTIRLWDITSLTQMCTFDVAENSNTGESYSNGDGEKDVGEKGDDGEEASTTKLVPTKLTMSKDGSTIAVIYDHSNRLDIFDVVGGTADNKVSLKLRETTNCASSLLSVAFVGPKDNFLFAVARDPEYVLAFKFDDTKHLTPTKVDCVEAIQGVAKERKIQMCETILEKDDYGKPALQKLAEKRVVKPDAPWNRAERIETAKQSRRRQRNNKRLRREAEEKANKKQMEDS